MTRRERVGGSRGPARGERVGEGKREEGEDGREGGVEVGGARVDRACNENA